MVTAIVGASSRFAVSVRNYAITAVGFLVECVCVLIRFAARIWNRLAAWLHLPRFLTFVIAARQPDQAQNTDSATGSGHQGAAPIGDAARQPDQAQNTDSATGSGHQGTAPIGDEARQSDQARALDTTNMAPIDGDYLPRVDSSDRECVQNMVSDILSLGDAWPQYRAELEREVALLPLIFNEIKPKNPQLLRDIEVSLTKEYEAEKTRKGDLAGPSEILMAIWLQGSDSAKEECALKCLSKKTSNTYLSVLRSVYIQNPDKARKIAVSLQENIVARGRWSPPENVQVWLELCDSEAPYKPFPCNDGGWPVVDAWAILGALPAEVAAKVFAQNSAAMGLLRGSERGRAHVLCGMDPGEAAACLSKKPEDINNNWEAYYHMWSRPKDMVRILGRASEAVAEKIALFKNIPLRLFARIASAAKEKGSGWPHRFLFSPSDVQHVKEYAEAHEGGWQCSGVELFVVNLSPEEFVEFINLYGIDRAIDILENVVSSWENAPPELVIAALRKLRMLMDDGRMATGRTNQFTQNTASHTGLPLIAEQILPKDVYEAGRRARS
ncbi:MAG: hypothetical protein LBD72_03740 [Puniceicoccales bacterium]|jgi:hypothetical protein|nr:hypothetical protein [Puniceicoccales bacterium]